MMEHLHEFYEELRREGVIFCFSGPTSQSVVEGIGQALKRKMELDDAGMGAIQRVFSLFVEQMQNIVNYSAEQTPPRSPELPGQTEAEPLKHGVIVIGRDKGKFYVICGNKVGRDQSERMLERIKYLKRLDRQALKAHYREARRALPPEDSRGAGLGFIEMFRRASEPIECNVATLDDETAFFSIKAVS